MTVVPSKAKDRLNSPLLFVVLSEARDLLSDPFHTNL